MARCLDRPRLIRRLGRPLLAACILHVLGVMVMWNRPRWVIWVMQGPGLGPAVEPGARVASLDCDDCALWVRTLVLLTEQPGHTACVRACVRADASACGEELPPPHALPPRIPV